MESSTVIGSLRRNVGKMDVEKFLKNRMLVYDTSEEPWSKAVKGGAAQLSVLGTDL